MIKTVKLAIIAILLITVSGYSKSKKSESNAITTYIRYNFLGYSPSRNKRIVVMSDVDIEKQKWTLTNESTGDTVKVGKFDKSVYKKGDHLPLDFNYVLDFSDVKTIGDYKLSTRNAEPALFPIKKNPYGKLVLEPLHWMRNARCGSHDADDHGFCHAGDTSCLVHSRTNPLDNGSWEPNKEGKSFDMSGGWHDAADYLKFSLTIGYSTYFILRAYEINPVMFDTLNVYSKTEFNDILDEGKWGLDWLMKAMPRDKNGVIDTTEFVMMVANSEDHNVGYRLPENDELDGKRPMLSALSAPQMGYASASLALGSKIFKAKGKDKLAKEYEDMARLIFRIATSKNVQPMAALNDEVNVFYGDETKNDNIALAAAELYRLTGEDHYKKESIKYSHLAGASGWKAWESVNMAAHMRVMEWYPVSKNYVYKDLDQFLSTSRKNGNIWGVPMKYVWGGLYSYIGVGAAALEFQELSGERQYKDLATNMLDYLLGYNNWGICFVATETLGDHVNTITDPYSQVYNLQANKFPRGAISEGPGDRASWAKFKHYFGFDTDAERTNKFNTSKGVFYDKRNDFMCMETTIVGVADGIFMLAIASKLFDD